MSADALDRATIAARITAVEGRAEVATWLYRITVRSAVAVRSHRRPSAPVDPEIPDTVPGPDGATETRLEAGRIARAMDRLPMDQRALLSLFAVDGLRHGQIAAILALPEGTVWSRLHAARKALGRAIEEVRQGDGRSCARKPASGCSTRCGARQGAGEMTDV